MENRPKLACCIRSATDNIYIRMLAASESVVRHCVQV